MRRITLFNELYWVSTRCPQTKEREGRIFNFVYRLLPPLIFPKLFTRKQKPSCTALPVSMKERLIFNIADRRTWIAGAHVANMQGLLRDGFIWSQLLTIQR